jgi:7,8-dihydropterin-6-yl-methyl-4-(beta-D-ribofuranosyl)aminobenzene 5'-phosphate synthase
MTVHAKEKHDIGRCKNVRIKCVSELTCNDIGQYIGQIIAAGGWSANQWEIPFDPDNAAGFCSLIDMETLDGRHHKFLLDTGWNTGYMDQCFQREGIDKMLENGEIEFLFISHEHMDHLWGLEAVLKYNPEIKIYISSPFLSEGIELINGAEFKKSGAKNRIPHQGELIRIKPGRAHKLFDGCMAVAFETNTAFRVRSEASLYFNVKDRGFVFVSACGHQNMFTLIDFAKENIQGGRHIYGIYGGLHIKPFEYNPRYKKMVNDMAKYQFKKIACNHCTGLSAVELMLALGYPVVRGSGRHGSKSKLHIGNGDEVVFG